MWYEKAGVQGFHVVGGGGCQTNTFEQLHVEEGEAESPCGRGVPKISHSLLFSITITNCRAIKTKGMVFRYTPVYSKEDTMAHTHRALVTS